MLPWTIPDYDATRAAQARTRQAALTKPPGSLGRLERCAERLAGAQANPLPRARPAAVLLFAADHPVTVHKVSAWPSSVTAAMVTNIVQGGAASSVLARHLNLPMGVFDVGVAEPYTVTPTPSGPTWERMSVGEAGDLRVEDAMTADVFAAAFAAGHRAVATLDADTRVIVLGEMGIGNTTPASAIYAALLGGDPADWVGPGAGLQALETKVQVVRDALSRVGADAPALEVLRRLGGREIAALAGAMVAGAERRMVSLIDGFIVTAAALAVVRHEPKIRDFMVFAHCSEEPGHRRALEALNAEPLLELGLALGEGSGALAAFSLLEQACTLHASMATFETAAVPGPEVP